MKASISQPHDDIQTKVMGDAMRAMADGANELCLREATVRPDVARMMCAELIITNLLAYLVEHGKEMDIVSRAKEMARRAQYAVELGRASRGETGQAAS